MKLGFLVAVLLAVVPRAARSQEDPCPASSLGVQRLASQADTAFTAMDDQGFLAALESIQASVACLGEPITPSTAAAVHRAQALAAFLDQDDPGSMRCFRAAIGADPAHSLALDLAPPGSELAMTYERARAQDDPGYTLLVADDGAALLLDGTSSARKPDGLPVVVQLLDRRGQVNWSGYLQPDDPWPEGVHPAPLTYAEPAERRWSALDLGELPVPRIAGAGALAVTAVALGVRAVGKGATWRDAEAHCETLVGGCSDHSVAATQHVHRQAAGLGVGAGIAAAGSLALGASLVWRW